NQRRDRQSTLHWTVSRRLIHKRQRPSHRSMVVPAEHRTINRDILPFRDSICIGHTRPRRSNRLTKNEDASLLRLLHRLFHHHLEPALLSAIKPWWLYSRPSSPQPLLSSQ